MKICYIDFTGLNL